MQEGKNSAFPVSFTFVVSYIAANSPKVGIAQGFRYREGQLFLLFKEEKGGPYWFPAICCKCRKIINIEVTREVMNRDNVSEKDLCEIEDFDWKFAKALNSVKTTNVDISN